MVLLARSQYTCSDGAGFKITVPAKLQAYLACGKPIVASIDGEGASIIEKANAGFVTKSEDSSGLAQCILKLEALSETDRKNLGLNGRLFYEKHYSREKLFLKATDLFESMF